MGIIFLRHAYSRYLKVKDEIVETLPKRDGQTRSPRKEDFSGKGAIYLSEESQFDYLVDLPDEADRVNALVHAMELIEKDYENLKGELPKNEYQDLDDDVLGQLLRTFNDPELKKANGDVFGRIYEYFLTQFADLKAHDNGEFFTPISLVQMIVNVIEPDHGTVLDPACGSGGMFVQSAHFTEQLEKNPTEEMTFYGLEKNPTTISLGKMNLAVHGLEGNIQKAITYYEDPHEMFGKADFVMANPPFNVDEVDAEKIKGDPRLPFGLPGVNDRGKVSNGNYLWISYFYSYLNDKGKAGFVMSSQASSAGNNEAEVRKKLVETGDVDALISIGPNFFYTRSVPCELWFLNKNKPSHLEDTVIMIDARDIYREVERTVHDFSLEQLKNITSILWLYRNETGRFLALIEEYFNSMLNEAEKVSGYSDNFFTSLDEWKQIISQFTKTFENEPDLLHDKWNEIEDTREKFCEMLNTVLEKKSTFKSYWNDLTHNIEGLQNAKNKSKPLVEKSISLIEFGSTLYKHCSEFIDICEEEFEAKSDSAWNTRKIGRKRKNIKNRLALLKEKLRGIEYYHSQVEWLLNNFPEAEIRDVKGLVKVVSKSEIKEQNWSLMPGQYVGASVPAEKDYDFEKSIIDIHTQLGELDKTAEKLSDKISNNFDEIKSLI